MYLEFLFFFLLLYHFRASIPFHYISAGIFILCQTRPHSLFYSLSPPLTTPLSSQNPSFCVLVTMLQLFDRIYR